MNISSSVLTNKWKKCMKNINLKNSTKLFSKNPLFSYLKIIRYISFICGNYEFNKTQRFPFPIKISVILDYIRWLRTCCERTGLSDEKIRHVAALDLIKCLQHMKWQRFLLTCAPISELPSNISTMAQIKCI